MDNTKNEHQYTITLNKDQLILLEFASEFAMRTIVGQLDTYFQEICDNAWEKEHKSVDVNWSLMNDQLSSYINDIRQLCWNQRCGEFHGIGYNEKADALFDMYQVLRKFRYDHIFTDEDRELMKNTNMANQPRHYSKQPLITVKEKDKE